MPFGVRPVCTTCKTTASTMWRKGPEAEVLCNSCGLKSLGQDTKETTPECEQRPITKLSGNGHSMSSLAARNLRKSSRLKPSRYRQHGSKSLATKGKSRRVIFKRNPVRSASAVATVVTSDYVFHDGIYWQEGDVVSLMDHDGGIYYAQVRGFVRDQFCNLSAALTWLLPTLASPKDKFDPATYILGPEEDTPRMMDCMEFVCHAPSDYYKMTTAPYPTKALKPELGYIWTNVGAEIAPVPTTDEIFGTKETKKTTDKTKSEKATTKNKKRR